MSETNNKYILNPVSGRYILKGGSLHRRLIRQGNMEAIEFTSRAPSKGVRRNINSQLPKRGGRVNNVGRPRISVSKKNQKYSPNNSIGVREELPEQYNNQRLPSSNVERNSKDDISNQQLFSHFQKKMNNDDSFKEQFLNMLKSQ